MATPQEALAAALEKWNAGDLDGYLELYDERLQLYGLAPQPLGLAEVRGFYEGLIAAFGTAPLTLDATIWADSAVTALFHMDGTHIGEFMGVPATGRDVVLQGMTMLRFEGDKVIERWSAADMLNLMVQLGAVPTAA
jgi:predicted ester cyclase